MQSLESAYSGNLNFTLSFCVQTDMSLIIIVSCDFSRLVSIHLSQTDIFRQNLTPKCSRFERARSMDFAFKWKWKL